MCCLFILQNWFAKKEINSFQEIRSNVEWTTALQKVKLILSSFSIFKGTRKKEGKGMDKNK